MMPNHIEMPAIGLPYADCSENVSHRKAPGAISAMALDVKPVRPSVALVAGGEAGPLALDTGVLRLERHGRFGAENSRGGVHLCTRAELALVIAMKNEE